MSPIVLHISPLLLGAILGVAAVGLIGAIAEFMIWLRHGLHCRGCSCPTDRAPEDYAESIASGLSDAEAREDAWPTAPNFPANSIPQAMGTGGGGAGMHQHSHILDGVCWCGEVHLRPPDPQVMRTASVLEAEYWGDPSGNIRRMSGEQEIIAIVTESCSNEEWSALCKIATATSLADAAANLIAKTRSLLEWMPQYSLSSSGHLRKLAVEMAIDRLEAHLKAAQL